MSGTRARFQESPVATIESATMHGAGKRAYDAVQRIRSKASEPWARKKIERYERIQRAAFEAIGRRRKKDKQGSIISELFSAVTGRKVDVSRIETTGFGTSGGQINPNLRVPMTASLKSTKKGAEGEEPVNWIDLTPDQQRTVLAAIGEEWGQGAMAASHFGPVEEGAKPDTYSVFIHGYEKGIPPDKVKEFSRRLGHSVNATQHPNGVNIDINPLKNGTAPSLERVQAVLNKVFSGDESASIRLRSHSGEYIEEGDYKGILDAHQGSVRRGRKATVPGARNTGAVPGNLRAVRDALRKVAAQRDREFNQLADEIEQLEKNPPKTVKKGVPGARNLLGSERGSFPIRLRRKPGKPLSPEFTFSDAEVQEAVTEAAAPPARPQSSLERWGRKFYELARSFGRMYDDLPRRKYYALAWQLKQQEKNASIAAQTANEAIQNITADLDENQFKAFSYKILLDDINETYERWKADGELPDGADDLFQLAFKLTPQRIAKDMPRLDAFVAADPKIQEAMAKREKVLNDIREDYTDAMQAAGFPMEWVDKDTGQKTGRFTREKYYRHRILEHVRDEALKARLGGLPRIPGGRSFLKERGVDAASKDYQSDYITAEYEVLAQMVNDTRKARFVTWLRKSEFNQQPELERKARAQTAANKAAGTPNPEVNWRDLIDPDTHEEWHPQNKNVFYLAYTLPEKKAIEAFKAAGQSIGLSADDIGRAVAKGGQRTGIVLPKEVVKTFEKLTGRELDPAEAVKHEALAAWKKYVLLVPWRFVKSQFRNLTGDLENTLGGNARGFTKVKQATSEIRQYYSSLKAGKPSMTPELRSFFEHGGFQSTQTISELGDLRQIEALERLLSARAPRVPGARRRRILEMPEAAIKKTFDKMELLANQREAVLRYSAYLSFLEQIENSPNGEPKTWGRSEPAEVKKLETPQDKAYKLANDLLGAYDEVSATGQKLAKWGNPFWRFQELNLRGFKQYTRNALRDPELIGKAGLALLGKAALRSPVIAMRVGYQYLKLASIWAAMQYGWNQMFFPDDDDSLREEIKARPHLTFGKHEDGAVRYFPRAGNLPDLAEWADLEDLVKYYRDVMDGRMSVAKAIGMWAWGGMGEKFILGSNPFTKLAYESITGRSIFPNIHEPRRIHDVPEYLADQFGLGTAYRILARKPMPYTDRGIGEQLFRHALNLVSYESDPGLAASYTMMDRAADWRARHGEALRGGGEDTLRSSALREMRNSLRLRDKMAFSRYIAQYYVEGGSKKGLELSIKGLHPLAGIKKEQRDDFVDSLSAKDQKLLDQAIAYWEDTFDKDKVQEYIDEAESSGLMEEAQEEKAAAGR
jgi:hypothetical protein